MKDLLLSLLLAAPTPTPGHPVKLPTHDLGHRFEVQPTLADGHPLSLYTDSGGGGCLLFPDTVKKLGLTPKRVEVDGRKTEAVPWPAFRDDAWIPAPSWPHFVVSPEKFESGDGFLGQTWFGGHTWTWDYPAGTIWLRANGDLPKHDASHEIAIHFPKLGEGPQFGRIEISVDGEPIPMLFDTGATISLSEAALKVVGAPKIHAGSFITQRTFAKWHAKHPTWRTIAKGDEVMDKITTDLIEVPEVKIAGYTTGPVWFAARPNKNFDQFMSSMMDGHVEGAFGGSGLYPFRVTVDYTAGKMALEKPDSK